MHLVKAMPVIKPASPPYDDDDDHHHQCVMMLRSGCYVTIHKKCLLRIVCDLLIYQPNCCATLTYLLGDHTW